MKPRIPGNYLIIINNGNCEWRKMIENDWL